MKNNYEVVSIIFDNTMPRGMRQTNQVIKTNLSKRTAYSMRDRLNESSLTNDEDTKQIFRSFAIRPMKNN